MGHNYIGHSLQRAHPDARGDRCPRPRALYRIYACGTRHGYYFHACCTSVALVDRTVRVCCTHAARAHTAHTLHADAELARCAHAACGHRAPTLRTCCMQTQSSYAAHMLHADAELLRCTHAARALHARGTHNFTCRVRRPISMQHTRWQHAGCVACMLRAILRHAARALDKNKNAARTLCACCTHAASYIRGAQHACTCTSRVHAARTLRTSCTDAVCMPHARFRTRRVLHLRWTHAACTLRARCSQQHQPPRPTAYIVMACCSQRHQSHRPM